MLKTWRVDIKLGRNDPCFCGSGKKYKKCHALIEAEDKVPAGKIRHEVGKEFKKPTCLYPKGHHEACSKKVISAHSVQKAKVLGPIKNSKNEVMTFYQSNEFGAKSIGWNQASTFNGFCGKHDKSIFLVIEDDEIKPTLEQIFVLGYRGFCHELYQKTASLRTQPYLLDSLLKGRSLEDQKSIMSYMSASNAGVKKGQREFLAIKESILDPAFIGKKYSDFSSIYIEFSGKRAVAACGAISPDYDVDNKPIQRLYDKDNVAHHMSISLVNEGDKIIFLIFWPNEYAKCNLFASSLAKLSGDDLVRKVFSLIFGYLENVYFSEDWWCGLSEDQQAEIAKISSSVFYVHGTPEISFLPIKWDVTSVVRNGF